jgi:hypothetical protein
MPALARFGIVQNRLACTADCNWLDLLLSDRALQNLLFLWHHHYGAQLLLRAGYLCLIFVFQDNK